MSGSAVFIAQLSDAGEKSGRLLSEIMPWLIVLVGVVLVGGVIIYLVRRSLRSEGSTSEGFTLQDLRDMHAAGELNDEEFDRAKMQMIGRAKTAPSPSGPNSNLPGAGAGQ